MKPLFKVFVDSRTRSVLLIVSAIMMVMAIISFMICRHALYSEAQVRYVGLKNVIYEKVAKTINGMEMSAMNVFDEVGKHMDSPEAVVAALKSKTHLNPEVRGYFAAFEPNYFPQEGQWFEPYVHHQDTSEFEYTQVGSARHDYTKSDWYIRAKKSSDSFWSDPYYYYDGTSMSGHYTTFVKPVFDSTGRLACVCGADITIEWLTKELQKIDDESRMDSLLNIGHLYSILDFYSVIIDKDGFCIVHPEGKSVSLTKEQVRSLSQRKSGTMDLEISGMPSTVYYSPTEHVDWTIALVVSKHDMQKPLLILGFFFFLIVVLGVIMVWLAISFLSGPHMSVRPTGEGIVKKTMLLGLCMMMVACSEKKPNYIIGVSQCSEDIWRNWQNAELRMEANFHEGVKLRFAAAHDNSERQIQQIDSLVDSGIDLLIVAPNQRSSVSPAIDRAYDSGIPVIVFERKTDSQKYTAFVSADNYEMGRLMGEYVVSRLGGKGQVMEILGLKGSSPADERSRGFDAALVDYPQIKVVAELQGDWTEPTAYQAVKSWKGDMNSIDLVFGHNDRSAMGARKAFLEHIQVVGGDMQSLPLFCGIDGLPGENGGIQQVRDSLLEASYIYPTRGDYLLQLALDILEGKPYQKETMLTSALVTHDNAKVLQLESDEVARQTQNLEKLEAQASGYLQQLATQRTITLMALILIALLVLTLVLFWLYHHGKVSAQHERVVNNLWNMEVPEEVKNEKVISEKSVVKDDVSEEDDESAVKEPLFLTRFKDVVEARLTNSDLSVDDLAAAMSLSRVQLYRKVKAISGLSPNELLRTARLNRGYQLLIKTDKTVSEVAYEVGFTAPSYFTKCFKDEFGISPSDLS